MVDVAAALDSVLGLTLGGVVVLENLASLLHFLAGALIALSGCPRRGLAVYTAYQAGMVPVKLLLADWYSLRDLDWDLVGDELEFLAGLGLVLALGMGGRLSERRYARLLCDLKVLLLIFGGAALYWTVMLATGWTPEYKP